MSKVFDWWPLKSLEEVEAEAKERAAEEAKAEAVAKAEAARKQRALRKDLGFGLNYGIDPTVGRSYADVVKEQNEQGLKWLQERLEKNLFSAPEPEPPQTIIMSPANYKALQKELAKPRHEVKYAKEDAEATLGIFKGLEGIPIKVDPTQSEDSIIIAGKTPGRITNLKIDDEE